MLTISHPLHDGNTVYFEHMHGIFNCFLIGFNSGRVWLLCFNDIQWPESHESEVDGQKFP